MDEDHRAAGGSDLTASTWRGREHPERPERYDAVTKALRDAGLLDRMSAARAPRRHRGGAGACATRRSICSMARRDVDVGSPVPEHRRYGHHAELVGRGAARLWAAC